MILRFEGLSVDVQPKADDPEDTGEGKTAWESLFKTADGRFEVGVWQFRGERTEAPLSGFEEAVVVLDGHGEVECDGQTFPLRRGDILVYESPIATKVVRAPDGIRVAWIVHYRV